MKNGTDVMTKLFKLFQCLGKVMNLKTKAKQSVSRPQLIKNKTR